MKRLVLTAIAVSLVAAASAHASVPRSCAYRNLAGGPGPYIAHVTTNLTPAALGGADVCAVVSEAVAQVQLRGYALDALPPLLQAGGAWTVSHRLVYPPGWPAPKGPVYDPHMQVTLHMVSPPPGQAARAGAGRAAGSYWIRLSELT